MPTPADAPHADAHDARARRDAFIVLAALLTAATLALGALSLLRSGHDPLPLPAARIDINTADAATLELLPGIGPALAERIAEERAASGPFTSVEDLGRVRGVGERTIRRLAPYIVAGPPGG